MSLTQRDADGDLDPSALRVNYDAKVVCSFEKAEAGIGTPAKAASRNVRQMGNHE